MIQIKEIQSIDLEKIPSFSEFDDFWTKSIFENDIKQKGAIYYQAVQEEQIVGILGAKQILDIVEVMNIAVRKDKRKQGIGKKLFEKFLQDMKEKEEVQVIELEVNQTNEVAIHLYESHGFQIVGKRPGYYGKQEDAILMNFEKKNSMI